MFQLLVSLFISIFIYFLTGEFDPKEVLPPLFPGAVFGQQTEQGVVTRVVDGDTLVVLIGTTEEKVRLVGINTPESVDKRRPVECFAREAAERMKELALGKKVSLESDETQSNRDKYDRLLRFVFLEDGRDVGLELIKSGFAVESLYSPDPHKYREAYLSAQAKAQHDDLGLWNPNACVEQ